MRRRIRSPYKPCILIAYQFAAIVLVALSPEQRTLFDVTNES
jgi:hypothetical protein